MVKFNLRTIDEKKYYITTQYNEYVIFLSEKGTGVYMDCENKLLLIKEYSKHNLQVAINYLLKQSFINP